MRNFLSIFTLAIVTTVIIVGGGTVYVHAKGMHQSGGSGTMMRGMMNDRSGHHGMMGPMSGMMNRMHRWMHGRSNKDVPAKQNAADTNSKVLDGSDTSSEKRTIRMETAFDNGLVYRGGDEINPTLRVQVGDKVEIPLENSIGSRHDLVILGLDVQSDMLNRRGETTSITFVPDEIGEFTYYCSVPGHREAGMEGTIIVTEKES